MKNDITQMRYYAAELRNELAKSEVEGTKVDVEAFEDTTDTPKIKVRSSTENYDQQTIYGIEDIVRFTEATDLHIYITVEVRTDGLTTPCIIIF